MRRRPQHTQPTRPRTKSPQREREALLKTGRSGRDPYWKVLAAQWRHVVLLYGQFADKQPVMLFDIQEQRVYAFPFQEFRAELNERSQASLTRQYERALNEGTAVVFVRDNEQKKLVSYSLPLQNDVRSPAPTVRGTDQRK
jgi:hypothetical protein